jgi:hypothetical protein
MLQKPTARPRRVRKETVGTRLPPTLAALVKAQAGESGVTPSEMIRRIVQAHFAAELAR